jgi:glycosidase
MEWTSDHYAGFSTQAPWLDVSPGAASRSVEAQRKDPSSVLRFYEKTIALRRSEPALIEGKYEALGSDPNVFTYRRSLRGKDTFIVALNMSDQVREVAADQRDSGAMGTVVLTTAGDKNLSTSLGAIRLRPYEGVLIRVQS